MLITMSNRIRKQRKPSSIFKKAFLSKVIVQSKEIPICENCFKRGLRSYAVSPLDFARCIEYVRLNRSGYDILSSTTIQLETLFSTHIHLETELEDTFEKQMQKSFHVVRLQAQKKIWREKLFYTIARSVFNMGELEKLKAEEAVKSLGVEE